MKRMKRLTAIMILAAMATISTPQAFGGIMLGDRAVSNNRGGIMLGDRSSGSILLGDLAILLSGIMLGD